jgi:hypothetical protein
MRHTMLLKPMRACTSYPRILAVLAWFLICVAQRATAAPQANPLTSTSKPAPPASDTSHCQALAAGNPQTIPLSAVCEFALTYRRELPDFICEQTTTSTGPQSTTVLKAQVTFEKDHESYSNITVDGKPRMPTRPQSSEL